MEVSRVSWPGEHKSYQTTEVGITGDQAITTVETRHGVLVCVRCTLIAHGPATHCRHVKAVRAFIARNLADQAAVVPRVV